MFNIVCYLGGTAGDLVVAMSDLRGSSLNQGRVLLDAERQKLKKSWQFDTDVDRIAYINSVKSQYNSVPSHDPEFHLRNDHSFIAIVVNHKSTAMWASTRFKNLHRPEVWNEMVAVNQTNTIEKYAQSMLDWSSWIRQQTNQVIELEDIIDGRISGAISNIISVDSPGIEFYNRWLAAQNENSNNCNT
jgi:hypothetical protein